MPAQPLAHMPAPAQLRELIDADAVELAAKLQAHQLHIFPPHARKEMRRFAPSEAARFLGIHDGYLRQIVAEGRVGIETPAGPGGRRTYSIDEIESLRAFLDQQAKGRRYVPRREPGEKLQIVSVMNFKGGSGKTTTAAHLAQFLALRGYRVLVIDLDPQASLSTLFGQQPELDVGENDTLYGAIRYDDQVRHIAEVIRATYMPTLHIIPANLELMEYEHETPRALQAGGANALFYSRIGQALAPVEDQYDVVVIDCPPQLGFLTLSALCTATAVLITVHPQMLDVLSMSQFLKMTGDLLGVVADHGAQSAYDWMGYLVTRYEPSDGPQTQMVGFMRSIFGARVLTNPMVKSTAISDAGLTKQTLYEVDRQQFTRGTYDRALEAVDKVNGEIEELIRKTWGRA